MRDANHKEGSLFQKTHSVENAILEIDLHTSRNILDLFPMIDLSEVDANLQCMG
jgi:hypothetical protein